MYLPAQFKEERIDVLKALMREHPFATVVAMSDNGLIVDHLPLQVIDGPSTWGTIRGHVARANPIWKDYRADSEAIAIFQGPQTYVSPSLYPSKQTTGEVVPTWNYAVVHARGTLRFIHEGAWLRDLVANLTDEHEAHRAAPWKMTDAPEPYLEKMLAMIVGLEFSISSVSGKWKLGQNRTLADRQGLVHGLQQSPEADARALAGMLAARE
jgi:transcriptional regulator